MSRPAPIGPKALAYAELLGLKDLARAGWKRLGVDDAESVAAHSWGVALLAALTCPPELDREKVLLMAILHDLAEVRVGDLTPYDGVPKAEKHRREAAAMSQLLAGHPELLAIWEEAEARQSPESKFLKHLDLLDLGLTARRYTARGHDVSELVEVGAAAVRRLDGDR